MKKSRILAHRGLWDETVVGNSAQAIKAAIEAGYGVETDIRDHRGVVVISHDPPVGDQYMTLDELISFFTAKKSESILAINVKSDGLASMMSRTKIGRKYIENNLFFFDMSIPDTLLYCKEQLPVYARESEYETADALAGFHCGVWLDNFTGNFSQVSVCEKYILQNTRVCIVSPELHKRDHLEFWIELRASGVTESPLVSLCTDFPSEAFEFFSREM